MEPNYLREGEQLPLEKPQEYVGNASLLMDYLNVQGNHRKMLKDNPSPAMASVLEQELSERREALLKAGVLTEANNDGVADAALDQFRMLTHLYQKNYETARDFRGELQGVEVQKFYGQAKELLLVGYAAMPDMLGSKLAKGPSDNLIGKMLREHFSA